MRLPVVVALASIVLPLAACHRRPDNVTANATAPAGFVPPTALNRTDFLNMVDRHFSQLDVNHDSELSQQEIPARHHDIIESFDTNHDGKVTKDEFEKGALARFDKSDVNGDKVLTGDERRAAELATDVDNTQDADNSAAPDSAANGG